MSAIQAGDSVVRKPVAITDIDPKKTKTMLGTVVWVHPDGRFHVVEFQTAGGTLRECFMGVERVC